jgi:hypothetical protein
VAADNDPWPRSACPETRFHSGGRSPKRLISWVSPLTSKWHSGRTVSGEYDLKTGKKIATKGSFPAGFAFGCYSGNEINMLAHGAHVDAARRALPGDTSSRYRQASTSDAEIVAVSVVTSTGVTLFRFGAGKISEKWNAWNTLIATVAKSAIKCNPSGYKIISGQTGTPKKLGDLQQQHARTGSVVCLSHARFCFRT